MENKTDETMAKTAPDRRVRGVCLYEWWYMYRITYVSWHTFTTALSSHLHEVLTILLLGTNSSTLTDSPLAFTFYIFSFIVFDSYVYIYIFSKYVQYQYLYISISIWGSSLWKDLLGVQKITKFYFVFIHRANVYVFR